MRSLFSLFAGHSCDCELVGGGFGTHSGSGFGFRYGLVLVDIIHVVVLLEMSCLGLGGGVVGLSRRDHFRVGPPVDAQLLCTKGVSAGAASPICIGSGWISNTGVWTAIRARTECQYQLAPAINAISLNHTYIGTTMPGHVPEIIIWGPILVAFADQRIWATPAVRLGNFVNTAGSCPGMMRPGRDAICFIRSWARRLEAASRVAAMGTWRSRFS